MAKNFVYGEQINRPPITLGQQNDVTQQLQSSRDQSRKDRSTPLWRNRGPAWRAWEGDTPPPIPEHLMSDAWMSLYSRSSENASSGQVPSSENTKAAQSIAAAPQQQQSGQGSEPQKVAQASAQPERSWLNSGIATKGGTEIIPFNGRIVRTNKEGKKVIIPVKTGQKFQMQPGDQFQYPMVTGSGKQKQLSPQQQRDAAIKKMPYGDKLVDAAKMVPDLLKGDAKAAYQKMISDPGFVGQLVAVSAIFTAVQFTPAGPFVNGALLATLGISAGFDLYNFLTKVGSAQDGEGLKNAAGYLTSLVETIGIAAVSGALRTAGRALGAIKADTSTAAVWKAIKGTQPVYEGTLIPKSFELTAGSKKLWVAPNATDHFRELVQGYVKSRGSTQNAEKYTQFLMADFKNSVDQALRQVKIPNSPGMPRQQIRIGNWDLVIGPPRQSGQLPVILHAQPMSNIYMP